MSNITNQKSSSGKSALAFLGRFTLSLLLFVLLLWIPAVVLQPWHSQWGATDEEVVMQLPGDELIPNAAYQATLGVTVSAPAAQIWPWLAQMGADRGGLYSYSWLESLLNCPIHNANEIIPAFQNPKIGDLVRMCPGDFGPSPHEIADLQPEKAFIFGGRNDLSADWDSTWQFVLIAEDEETTRLLLRLRSADYASISAVFEPAFFLMERRRLQGIQERAEGQFQAEWRNESEILLWIASFLGFLIAGGMLVFRRAWKRPALLTGIIAALTLFLAFAQPPLWIDVMCVLLIYGGLVWGMRTPVQLQQGLPLKPAH
jgi:hypothetical protein